MKAEQKTPPFQPVSVILTTMDDYDRFYKMAHFARRESCVGSAVYETSGELITILDLLKIK